MKHLVPLSIAVLFVAIAFAITRPAPPSPPVSPDTRVIYVVRHAEQIDGEDPELSPAGHARAQRLAGMLAHEPLAAVFVTDTNRSRQTGSPSATRNRIDTTTYPATDAHALRTMLDALPANTNALVVAHSNTVSAILESLGAQPVGDLPEDEFSCLYAVVLTHALHARTLQLSY